MSVIDTTNPFGVPTSPLPSQFSEMSSEDFLKVIFTELTNQDPLAPSDSAALLQQLSTIRSIESDMKMMQHLESLVHGNQLAAAGNLVGKFIGGMTSTFQNVAGWVVALVKEGNSIYLEMDTGYLVPLENVTTVIDPSLLPDDPGVEDPGDNDDVDPGDETPEEEPPNDQYDEDGYDQGADPD